jgi:formamidopyrimidine-DNA glycosylase
MPELADLEAKLTFLNKRLPGLRVEDVQMPIAFIVRMPKEEFVAGMVGNVFGETSRRGKFLLIHMESGHVLAVNSMLAGRMQWCQPTDKKAHRTCVIWSLSDGHELRYVDFRLMGRVYLVKEDDLKTIPQFAELGPDAASPELTEDVFVERLQQFNGQIKNVLTNQKFIAGIGNAYSDEILFVAKINPFRKRGTLSDEEMRRLYRAIHEVFDWAFPIVREAMQDDIPLEEVRYFMRVHRGGGQDCPVCGNKITDITSGNKVMSYCRHCQPPA